MPNHLNGHHALVTGARQGVGRAVAERLAADGAAVAVNDRDSDAALDTLAASIRGVSVPADVSDPAAVDSAAGELPDRLGSPVDILVANAAYMAMAPFADHDPTDWWRVVDTCLGGTFAAVQAILPQMRRRGGGRIVLVASEWGITGRANATAYSAAKGGQIALAKSLGRELAPEGIVVNAIAPSMVDTEQLDVDARDAGVTPDEIRRRYGAAAPLGRVASRAEITAAVAFLCDFRVATLVGQVLHVNGGTTRARG